MPPAPSHHRGMPLPCRVQAAAFALFCLASCLRAGDGAPLSAPFRYRRDGGIGLSVANEMDAAKARARHWLAMTQEEDGSWASTNACGATALAALALEGGGDESRMARARAIAWLRALPEDALRAALPEERAWRDLALALVAAPAGEDPPPGRATDAPMADDAPFAWAVANMARAESGESPLPEPGRGGVGGWMEQCAYALGLPGESPEGRDARETFARDLGVAWGTGGIPEDGAFGVSRQRWFLAHFVNACANGILVAPPPAPPSDGDSGGETGDAPTFRVPWRETMAGALIAAQRVDPRRPGAAYWVGKPAARAADWAAEAVPETAFAILCLGEL